jgi:glycosyltransferase involved in cell wall biosynthesis
MKIMMLSPFAPYPPDSGGRIRQWEFIKYLGSRHDLKLAFFINRGEEEILRGAFDAYCSKVFMITHTREASHTAPEELPWPVRIYGVGPMRDLVRELSRERFDLALIDYIYMAQYRGMFSSPAVLNEQNIESSLFRQYSELPDIREREIFGIRKNALFWKAGWMLMRDYENKTWPGFDLRITVSSRDKEEMDSRCPDGKTVVAENGVSSGEIALLPSCCSKKILFVGTMNYYPNIDGAVYMVEEIMPLVRKLDPEVRLCIAGKNMPDNIRRLGLEPGVEIVENPATISAVASECALSVVPLRLGGGTRIKILESFALGLPVVTTSKGCEGLAVEDGRHLIVRDGPEGFAAAVAGLLNDRELCDILRANGRRLAEERYDWQTIYAEAEAKMMELATGRGMSGQGTGGNESR